MKRLHLYGSYEQANDAQITLLASDIDAKVQFVQGSSVEDTPGGYALLVEDGRCQEAEELLAPGAVADHRSLLRCPACDSERIAEPNPPWWGMFFLAIPLVVYAVDRWSLGPKFRCEDCRNEFRKKP